jgi:DNA-binding response OmpR family regulator
MDEVNILLLVEDDDNDILFTQRKLAKSAVPINDFLVAKTLAEATNIINTKHIDIILLDLNLPDSKSLDTLRSILNIYKGIVIVLTSIDDEAVGLKAIHEGADEYLTKNQLTDILLARAIRYSIERRRLRERTQKIRQDIHKLDSMLKSE